MFQATNGSIAKLVPRWSNIVDGTPANVTYSGATTADLSIQPNTSVAGATGYYKCVVTCGDVSSNNRKVTFVQYCDSAGGSISGITGVTFGTIDNTIGIQWMTIF